MNSFYPVLMTDKLQETVHFYRNHLGFEATFESDWYISLKEPSGHEIALIDAKHSTIPQDRQTAVAGLILNVEVDDAERMYKKLVIEAGIAPLGDLRDEEYGQRHFIVSDPNGVLLDIIQYIPPSEEFMAMYHKSDG